MALVEKPDPRKKLMLAGALDSVIILIGVALFITSGNMFWVVGAIVVGAVVGMPLIITAMRELKEQNDASR